jgi:acetylornithine deacetylase/succinyl-diaminopimelate desuccinylase-like protein
MKISDRILNICKVIQQVPAPTFHEHERAAFVLELFEKEDLTDVHLDAVGNVYGYIPGESDDKFIVVSAHLDTVFPIETDLSLREDGNKLYGAGIGDNSLGVAGLFGLLWVMQEQEIKFPGGIWLVANVCEEGLGDLNGMREIVKKFGGDAHAYLILEGTAYRQIYHRGLGVKRYEVKVNTEGGHSWGDYGKPSAIHEIAKFISSITDIEIPSIPRTSINVGIIEGGTSINTIAPEARIEIDLRSEGSRELRDLAAKVEKAVDDQNREGVKFSRKVIGDRPSGMIPEEHALVKIARDAVLAQGDEPVCTIGSTDANIPLSFGYPAITVGLTTGGGVHTIHEYIDIAPFEKGISQMLEIVKNIWTI